MFDEYRIKRILKGDIDREKYERLPEKFKYDKRIIDKLINIDPKYISIVLGDISSFVLNDKTLIQYLTDEQLKKFFNEINHDNLIEIFKMTNEEKQAQMFSAISYGQQIDLLKNDPQKYMKYLDEENNKGLIIDIIKCKILGKDKYQQYLTELVGAVSDYAWDIITISSKINEDDLKKLVLNLNNDSINELLGTEHYPGVDFFRDYITEFSKTLQKEDLLMLCEKNSNMYDYVSEQAKDIIDVSLIGDRACEAKKLSDNAQILFFRENPHLLKLADITVRSKVLENITYEEAINCNMLGSEQYSKFDTDTVKKLISGDASGIFWYCIFNNKKEGQYLKPKDTLRHLVYDSIKNVEGLEKQEGLRAMYESLSTDKIIYPEMRSYNGPSFSEFYMISKLLLDENVVKNNSVELLLKYKDNFDRNDLIQILSNAYGEHVQEIFDARPNLDIVHINNLNVFNKNIYDVLGKNFINYTFNSDMHRCNHLIYQFANDPKLLEKFNQYFNVMTKDIETVGFNVTYNLLDKFLTHKDIFTALDFSNLSDDRKQKMGLLISDIDSVTAYVRNVEDLDNYLQIRNQRFSEIIDNIDNTDDLRDHMMAYFVGRNLDNDEDYYTMEKLTLNEVIKIFDINTIAGDNALMSKMNLNKDDVALLMLLHEISKIDDISVLRDTFKASIYKCVDSKLLTPTFDKIKEYCYGTIKENILSEEKLDNMDKIIVDGVEVAILDGENFSALVHNTGVDMNQSGRVMGTGADFVRKWIYTEGGTNTISTWLASSDTSVDNVMDSCHKNKISLIFGNDTDILFTGASDIGTSHDAIDNEHSFLSFYMNKPMIVPYDKLVENINKNNDEDRFPSEIAIARFNEDITKENSGNRQMPIACYVVGADVEEISSDILQTAKAFNDYYRDNNILDANGNLKKCRIVLVNPLAYGNVSVVNNVDEDKNVMGGLENGRSI